jgi:hypothetical protein
MGILFGTLLSGLIVQDFMKASASALQAGDSMASTLPIILLGVLEGLLS